MCESCGRFDGSHEFDCPNRDAFAEMDAFSEEINKPKYDGVTGGVYFGNDDFGGVDFSTVTTNNLVWVGNILVEIAKVSIVNFELKTTGIKGKIEPLELSKLIDSLYDESAFVKNPVPDSLICRDCGLVLPAYGAAWVHGTPHCLNCQDEHNKPDLNDINWDAFDPETGKYPE